MSALLLEEYTALTGKEIGVSRWFEIDQPRIDKFADVTEDWQFIHLKPEEAAKAGFGGTIAHGFLTLSLMAAMAYDGLPAIKDSRVGVNYGFDKVRFVAPVRSGSRVRARFRLLEVTARGPLEILNRFEVVVEIDGSSKPALVAEWLGLTYLAEPPASPA